MQPQVNGNALLFPTRTQEQALTCSGTGRLYPAGGGGGRLPVWYRRSAGFPPGGGAPPIDP